MSMVKSMEARGGSSGMGMSARSALVLILAMVFSVAAAAQDAAQAPKETGKLPRTFRGYSLGMSLESLKTALAADELFTFRGDRDVSLLPQDDQTLVETTGLSFIRRAFFQFKDGALFIMAFTLNQEKVDHYSVFTTFVADYGDPTALDPGQAVWTSDDTRVSIERPLTVKYIDRTVFDSLAEKSRVKDSRDAVLRKDFLDGF